MSTQEKKVTRKLRAILSADVKGYSILMSDDEAFTVERLKAYRAVMSVQIEQHTGRVVDAPGDNLLAEFASVVDAVQCAVEIQKILKDKNEELPVDKRLEFRIGVNIGDVIQDGDNLYGEGINIAARIEGLAEPGGVCISRNAYDHISNKLNYGYEYLGEHSVKNITKPVRVYKVLMADEDAGKLIGDVPKPVAKKWIWATAVLAVIVITSVVWQVYQKMAEPEFEPASVEEMAYPLPEKPSIAVLPFDNLSGDTGQDYLADGVTENIITALSKIPEMFIIARNSVYTYKGKPIKVQKVAEDLGIRYVLEGSIQKEDDRIRITAQLIDATTGHHLWAEKYDRKIEDLFAIQDEITLQIVSSLQVKLTDGEQARLRHKSTESLKAWGLAVRGYSYWHRYTKEDNAKARELFHGAIEVDPDYAWAWTMLGFTYFIDTRYGWHSSRDESFKKMVECAQKSVLLDDSDPDVHILFAHTHLWQKEYDKAIEEGEKSLSLGPNSAENHANVGMIYRFSGWFEDSIRMTEKAIRLHPYYPDWYLYSLEYSYYYLGQHEKAIALAKKHIKLIENRGGTDTFWQHLILAQNYIRLGQDKEARYHATEALRQNPEYTFKWERKGSMYKDPDLIEQQIDDLRKAGLTCEDKESEKATNKEPPKPSIAVLAFDNLSGDPEQEYFSDGITEDIITGLSKTPKIFVVARNSSFTYKGKPVKVQEVGQELGVRYVLEGSVRKAEGKVRITAQLIDAKTGHHLWAERYDRDLKDIFDIQDEITKKIITALRVHLTEGEIARVLDRHTNNIQAYMKILEGSGYFGEDKYSEGMKSFEEAISLDPQCASAHGWLSWAHLMNVWFGPSASREQSLKKAFEFAEKCKELDPKHGGCYGALSHAYLMKRDYEKAISEGKRAVELDPNTSRWAVNYGWALRSAGRYKDALLEYERALRLNPLDKTRPLEQICTTYNMMRRHEEAIETCKKVTQLSPKSLPSYINLTVAYSELDKMEEAREAAGKVLKIYPNFSMDSFEKTLPYKNKTDRDLYVNGLRKAGLK